MKEIGELITKGEEVFLLTEDVETVSLPQAVGALAMSVYENMLNIKKLNSEEEIEKAKKVIIFQTRVLNALSHACEATRDVR